MQQGHREAAGPTQRFECLLLICVELAFKRHNPKRVRQSGSMRRGSLGLSSRQALRRKSAGIGYLGSCGRHGRLNAGCRVSPCRPRECGLRDRADGGVRSAFGTASSPNSPTPR